MFQRSIEGSPDIIIIVVVVFHIIADLVALPMLFIYSLGRYIRTASIQMDVCTVKDHYVLGLCNLYEQNKTIFTIMTVCLSHCISMYGMLH